MGGGVHPLSVFYIPSRIKNRYYRVRVPQICKYARVAAAEPPGPP
eukprot:gene7058-4998_t